MSGHHHGHAHGPGGHHGPEDGEALTTKALLVTLRVNIVLMCLKWVAFVVTGSSSLYAEALHSTADTLNPFLLQIGDRRGRRDACGRHPQGHVRERLFWSLLAAIGMFLVGGCWNAYHGIDALVSGHRPEQSPLAIGIMSVALLLEARSLAASLRAVGTDGSLRDALRAVKASRDTAALAVVFENFADILGVLLALTGFVLYVLTGNPVWDAAFSLAIAGMLMTSSLFLIARNRSLIVGETMGDDVGAFIRDVIAHRGSAEVLDVQATVLDGHHFEVVIRLRWNEAWFVARHDRAVSRFRLSAPVDWTIRRTAHERRWLEDAVRGHYPDATTVLIVAE